MNVKHPLTELYESCQPELLRSIVRKFRKNHADAEDIIQDAFHNILRADNFESLDNPRAYLYQAASNLALNRIRNQKRRAQLTAMQHTTDEDTISPERSVMAKQDILALKRSIDELPEKYRKTFLLSREQGKSYRAIAAELNIAESTVEKHIIRVLKHLKTHLDIGGAI
ncbi:RNA polymerase sigma factor [Teredinibacter haidensis]|uniref:RNA polymerase sigma factor n=1 Tax=Teredinibacter haidensis TaxID=2731755 RepID=UPI000948C1E3|nr:sigma-70 family RNA polymerase sigma factor [Teredinibacter haidensis]